MNQIINMIIRQLTRKFVNKGIDAGFNKASSMQNNRKKQSQSEIDDYGNPIPQKANPTKRLGGGQGAKQAKQAMRAMRRFGKF
ncbi:hypothetical protein GGR95_001508 [Sulfitobacter undariae]|uniref:Uncharacterized protein n=1 Tax=Sulfitobacter undariae TaxID=1563671 RepID=A0A7W6E332_9RHOB|nr:hypothetical protein [Sulfitobacter undariae]MBB3993877.1 hypothetical protein [Sulfitobacter undariae]